MIHGETAFAKDGSTPLNTLSQYVTAATNFDLIPHSNALRSTTVELYDKVL
jgi:hypothetical protein